MTETTPRAPFEFDREEDGTLSLSSAVHQALGAASVCWESMAGTGTFDEARAREIADALLDEVHRAKLWPHQPARQPRPGGGPALAIPVDQPVCTRCEGCGQIASSSEGEPWSAWAELPPGSDLAVRAGVVRPLTCPDCGGLGVRS